MYAQDESRRPSSLGAGTSNFVSWLFPTRYTRVSVTSKTVLNCLDSHRVHSLGGDGVRPVTNGSGIASTVVTVCMYVLVKPKRTWLATRESRINIPSRRDVIRVRVLTALGPIHIIARQPLLLQGPMEAGYERQMDM